ncbi:response regulator [Pelomonas baiyunensis]|uniref:histidine kinase n=1 Tax=Pelomonas baiyunensis TaxID=3299026 RepID=A0ABW7GWC7_9BURK
MDLRDARLLLVDDDPTAIHTMRHLLSDFPNLNFASTGEEALRLARASRPDLIVLDARMPGMDGLQVYDAMRRDPDLRAVPVIMATADDETDTELAAVQRGVNDFITKPLVPETFRARVRARLRERALMAAGASAGTGALPAADPGRARDLPALLIIDDDAAAVQMLGSTLQDLGSIHFVTEGRNALKMARRIEPDLVLLDAMMPGQDGFAICAALKADPRLKGVPVVFVTRYDRPADETRALELGAADFVSKPIVAPVLRARVRNLLDLKLRQDAELRAAGERWRRIADARVSEIVRTATDAILVCDEANTVLLANAAAAEMFAGREGAVVGSPLSAWLDAPTLLAEQARRAPVRLQLSGRNGAPKPVEATASALVEGQHQFTTWVLRDISDRERLQAESVARAAAEAASTAKTRMIGVIAHELGNPLNAVLGFAQIMRMDPALDAKRAEGLDRIQNAGRAMQHLIEDLLEFARGETGALKLNLGAVDLRDTVAEALAAVAPAASWAGVDVREPVLTQRPPLAQADARRLTQCLSNLLSNAVKYNERGGHVGVEIDEPAPGRVRVAVRDDGMGMDETQLHSLFEPFNRLGRERSDRPGTGLGLAITRQLVHAMHGELSVTSTPGQGSCFAITLRCA